MRYSCQMAPPKSIQLSLLTFSPDARDSECISVCVCAPSNNSTCEPCGSGPRERRVQEDRGNTESYGNPNNCELRLIFFPFVSQLVRGGQFADSHESEVSQQFIGIYRIREDYLYQITCQFKISMMKTIRIISIRFNFYFLFNFDWII